MAEDHYVAKKSCLGCVHDEHKKVIFLEENLLEVITAVGFQLDKNAHFAVIQRLVQPNGLHMPPTDLDRRFQGRANLQVGELTDYLWGTGFYAAQDRRIKTIEFKLYQLSFR